MFLTDKIARKAPCGRAILSHNINVMHKFQVFLGQFPMTLFSDDASVNVLEQFSADVKQIGIEIDERNQTWKVPYTYLHPSTLPCRIDF